MNRNIICNHNSEYLKQSGWGVFFHFLASPASSIGECEYTTDEWNRRVDDFDTTKLASQLEEIGAGYFFITLGQNSGFYISPNPTYDEIVGRHPSRCSDRDLVSDLYDALEPRGIKLLAYLPANAPIFDKQAMDKLKFAPAWQDRDPEWCGLRIGDVEPVPGVDSRMSEFQRNWEAIIHDWSTRWEDKVIGWWIDGCYHPDLMYDFPDEPNFASFKAALKAGNPDALVSFAIRCGTVKTGGWSDFTAGEMNYSLPVTGKHSKIGQTEDGSLYHLLTFLGEYWGAGKPRFSAEFATSWMRQITDNGGVVTWDVPPTANGTISDDFMRVMSKFRNE